MAKHSRCMVSCRCSVSMSERSQCPMGLVMSTGCFWRKKQQICTLHESVSSVVYPPEYGRTSTGGDISAFFEVSMAWSSWLLSGENNFGWYFFSLWFSGETICVKLGMIRLKMLHKSQKGLSLVRVFGSSSPRIASVVCDERLKLLARVKWST